uniref:Uncharacterized protein n=1 Tax=Rhizophora mucronata TaxID=61149 RepID=A0A2P2P076_RHIMU
MDDTCCLFNIILKDL